MWKKFKKWLNDYFIKDKNTIINELKNWVENNSDKKLSTWDFVIDLLQQAGIEVDNE